MTAINSCLLGILGIADHLNAEVIPACTRPAETRARTNLLAVDSVDKQFIISLNNWSLILPDIFPQNKNNNTVTKNY